MNMRISASTGGWAGPWRQWRRTVRCFALRTSARHTMAADDYHARHQRLLAWIHHEQQNPDPHRAALAAEAGELLAPWISLDALKQADPALLIQVVAEAERLQWRLEGRRPGSLHSPKHTLRFWGLTLAGGLLVVLILQLGEKLWRHNGLLDSQHYCNLGERVFRQYAYSDLAELLAVEGLLFVPLLWFWRCRC